MDRLRLVDLSFSYRRTPVLSGVSAEFAVPKGGGSIVAIAGQSGCGKTTLLRLLAGALRPNAGRIEFAPGSPVVSYLPQEPVLFEHLTTAESVRFYSLISAYCQRYEETLLNTLISELRLEKVLGDGAPIGQLSGGEKQRLCLARALSIRPDILLLDEPCTGLDPDVKLDFLRLLRRFVDEFRILALYVSHHPDETLLIADELMYIRKLQAQYPNDGGGTQVEVCSIKSGRDLPPSKGAAFHLAESALNSLKCNCRQGSLYLDGTDVRVASFAGALYDGLAGDLMFPANIVNVVPAGGFQAEQVGCSGLHGFFKPIDQPSALIVGPQANGGRTCQLSLNGCGHFYSVSGRDQFRVFAQSL